MRIANILVLGLLLGSLFPTTTIRAAAPSDQYADEALGTSTSVYRPSNAIGAPDGAYADFQDTLASVTLDMGEGEEGLGDLTLTYRIYELGAAYRVELMDADSNVLQNTSGTFSISSTVLTVPYSGTTSYRYVKVTCVENEQWSLDAITAASVAESVAAPEPTSETPTATSVETSTPQRGMLVKLLDDGDPATTVDEAVYVVDDNDMRHAFPSETVFKTWYQNFDDIAYIDPANLASYALGPNVTVRPGTWLVKITTNPKVYAVEPGGVLRWITSEEIARALFGTGWAQRVIDVPDTFWGNYVVGEPITTEVPPAGSVGAITSGAVVYLDSSKYYTLPGDTLSYMRFISKFFLTINDSEKEHFAEGGDLPMDPNIAFPY